MEFQDGYGDEPTLYVDKEEKGFVIRLDSENLEDSRTLYSGHVTITVSYTYIPNEQEEKTYDFRVLEDGSLYANAANIKGIITTEEGHIGGWIIRPTGLR